MKNSDGVTRLMESADIPLSVENYLAAQFMGDVPPLETLDEEFLEMIPPWFAVQIRKRQEQLRRASCG
jgi:hypothetical protein